MYSQRWASGTFRVSTKQKNKTNRFEPKITDTGSVMRLLPFLYKTNENLVSVCFGVSNVFRNNQNKQFCFKMNQIKPKMYIETSKTKQICFKMNQNKPKMYIETAETNRFVSK